MGKILKMLLEFIKMLFQKKVETTPAEPEAPVIPEPVFPEVTEPENNEDMEETITIIDSAITPSCGQTGWYNGMVVLLDNGHAKSTSGKRSPVMDDGYQFFEYEFNRAVVKRISEGLDKMGIENYILVPEVDTDVSLTTRANRANNVAAKYGRNKCILVSVHANAFGDGKTFNNARGWCIYTTKGVTKSDEYATIFFEEAEKVLPAYGMTLRKDMSDGDPDWEENFTVIYKTVCPAVLTENLFYTNLQDVKFLRSEKGRDVIAQIHLNALRRICSK